MKLSALEVAILAILSIKIQDNNGQDFGYEGNNGPSHWGEKYHSCVGKHQSPIDIQEHNVRLVNLPPMIFTNFDWKPDSATYKNTGHTVAIYLKTQKTPTISGGPLISSYEFSQLHFHWGANDLEGSENTINNNSFPLELHMVFYNPGYLTYEEATEHPDGLTVLSFLFSNSKEDNPYYENLLNTLPLVEEPHSTTNTTEFPFLEELLPENLSTYYTYGGSLTTPPCSEVVTWIEFKNTIKFSHNQLEKFRQLGGENGKLLHNFRPVQPLHGRTIRMNRNVEDFRKMKQEKSQSTSIKNVSVIMSSCLLLMTIFLS